MKLKSNMTGGIEERADCAIVDTASFDIHNQRNSVQANLLTLMRQVGCDEKYKHVPEDVTPTKTLKELLKLCDDTEKAKGKTLETFLDLRRSMTVCLGIEDSSHSIC